MRLPEIPTTNDQIQMLNRFMGLNRTETITEQEFSDMKNITNDYFPVIAPRGRRALYGKLERPLAVKGGQALIYVDEVKDEDGTVHDYLFINQNKVLDLLDYSDKYKGKKRQLLMMGALLFVYPEGVVFNTATREIATVNNKRTATATFSVCTYAGSDLDIRFKDSVRPTEPNDGDYWYDTSKSTAVLKIWTATTMTWNSVGTCFIKIKADGIAEGFNDYDAAVFSDIDDQGKTYNGYNLNQTNIIYKAHHDATAPENDYIMIAGYINDSFTSLVNVERKMPEMDFVVEQDNRLWGCSTHNHEIYASKLGDPKNWYCYAGLDNDSYAVTLGTQGEFTGAIAYNSTVYFFKEDGMYRVWGTKPSNFEVQWKPCKGVQYGSSDSLAVVGDYLFYKARDGVVQYDGTANIISTKLGREVLFDAVAESYGDKYYISMRNNAYKYKLYVYDVQKASWCIEDSQRYWFMAKTRNGLHLIDNKFNIFVTSNEEIYKLIFPSEPREDFPEEGETGLYYPMDKNSDWFAKFGNYPGNSIAIEKEKSFEWSLTSGDMGLDTPFNHYLKRLDIRMQLDFDTRFIIEVAYDKSEAYERIMEYRCTRQKTVSIPVRVNRCNSFKIRISGKGDFKLFSITKIVEEGSDI